MAQRTGVVSATQRHLRLTDKVWTPEEVKELRQRAGWTQANLGDLVGKDVQTVGAWERPGKRKTEFEGERQVLLDRVQSALNDDQYEWAAEAALTLWGEPILKRSRIIEGGMMRIDQFVRSQHGIGMPIEYAQCSITADGQAMLDRKLQQQV